MPSTLTGDLAALVGADHVVVDADIRAAYEVDWTGRFHGPAAAVVRPGSVDEIAAVVALCVERGVAIVPQGGNTGLVGGSVPAGAAAGAIVLSTRRLDRLEPVDVLAGQVTAGAGVPLARLHTHAGAAGWAFGVDLGARDTATIGGMVATNAGGIRVLRHGTMRAQVLGVEAALGTGAVVRHLGGLVKDNTGYDLTGLLVGSEGTLGIVTAARLRLVPSLPDRVVVLAAVPTVAEAVALVAELRASVDGLDAIEAVLGDGLQLACEQVGLPRPYDADGDVALLAEWAGHGEPPAAFAKALAPYPAAAAADAAGRARLWRYREEFATAIARLGVPHKLDVTLPAAAVATFVDALPGEVARVAPSARLHLFGHLGDGNLHVNVTGVDPDDEAVDDAVLRL
ncbi:MAG TPA: FAD-binding oxidoreductase, partial [Acidimicrobiales bacterium]|nr:FAD-binding oxidoreductase [Acidimicrobiales bacterium]